MHSIKLKLTLAFLISILAIGTAGYFAYTSFSNLANSVATLSKPDNTASLLNDVVSNLVQSENEMRMYTLNADEKALNNYIENMEAIDGLLDSLRKSTLFSEINASEVDTLLKLVKQKASLMADMVEIKNDQSAKLIANKAMNKITNTINENEKKAEKYSDTLQATDPGIKETSNPVIVLKKEATDSAENESGWISNILRSKKKKREQENKYLPETIPDTSRITNVAPVIPDNNVLATNQSIDYDAIRDILMQLNKSDKQYVQESARQELQILASDKLIMDRIKEIITKAEQFQANQAALNLSIAKQTADSSSKIIFIISILGLLAGFIFTIIIINDINKSNKYKKELEVAKENAEYHAKAKELFLANMSHEIRTPLNAIIGFSEQLQETPLMETQDEYVHAVRGASEHLLNIVNDILDLTKIEAGKIVIQKNVFSVSEVIAEVAHIMQVKANEKSIGLEFFYDDASKELIRGDDFRLKQILYNLIGNAIKFTHRGFVKITCNSVVADPYVHYTIEVKDSGIGIPEDKLKTIFEDFTQADDSTTKKYGGTGLGLSISKKLIELQQGQLIVTSKENEGSSFIVKMRYRIPSQKQIAAYESGEKTQRVIPKNINILLVDDEPFNLALASVIFKKHNIDNTCIASAREAMQLFSDNHFDMVFADLHMPEEDGFTFARKLRNMQPSIPILALTANVMHDERDLLSASGFNDIVIKPYKEQDILDKIIYWIKKGNAGRSEITNTPDKEESLVATDEMHAEDLPLFSLEEIKLFTTGDDQLIVAVIQSFVESNKLNIETLGMHCLNKNIEGINNTAHKMLPGYNHFKVFTLIPVLKKFEILTYTDTEELNKDYACIKSHSEKVFEALNAEMKLLEERTLV